MNIEALYIHIPFCDHICIYCDFYKMISKSEEIERYFYYLKKEVNLKSHLMNDIKTIYIGGGTPSLVHHSLIDDFLTYLFTFIDYNKIEEFTFEFNCKDVSLDLLKVLKKHHVNRISLGVQSTNDEKLKILSRNHLKIDIINAIDYLHKYGFDNISCDLIYGLSNDNISSIKEDIDLLMSLKITHFSCYTLIIEKKTILNKLLKEHKVKILDDDKEAEIYQFITKYLKQNGYYQYEISNYAKQGYASKHNITYWKNKQYLGLGSGASYYILNHRYKNITNLKKYYQGIENKELIYSEFEKVDASDMVFNEIMLGLRMNEGININDFLEKYNINLLNVNSIKEEVAKKNIIISNGFMKIPEDKLYISNYIITKILIERIF